MRTISMLGHIAACVLALGVLGLGCNDAEEPSVVDSVTVAPPSPTLDALGATVQFVVAVEDQFGDPMTGVTVTWRSSNTSVATIDPASGLATAVGNGTTTIEAEVEGVTGSADLTVGQVVTDVAVSPATATLDAIGATQQFTATVEDRLGNTVVGAAVMWSSSGGAATIDPASGLATAVADGTTQITAMASGVTGSANLTVAQQTASIVVTPDPATMIGIGATLQLSAEAFDANGFTLGTQPTFAWSSSDDLIATVDPATGLSAAQAQGMVQMTASASGVSGSAPLTVLGILHWTDLNLGTSAVPGAMTLLGLTQTDAVDAADFVAQLQAGGWGLVVFGEQDGFTYSGAVQTELDAYVAGGGELLGVTWLQTTFAPFMEATFTGANYASLIPDGHPIFAGFGGPIGLSNPGTGWGVYAQRYQPAGAGVCIGSTDAGDCAAILGNGGSTLLLGPLFDTYATLAEGEQFVAQSMQFLIDQAIATATAARTVVAQPRRTSESAPQAEPGQRPQNRKRGGAN